MPPAPLPARFPPPAAAPAAATAAAKSATAAARAGRHRLGLVDRQVPAAEAVVVQLFDRLLRFLVGGHFDEPEAPRPAGGHVAHDLHALDGAAAGKQLLEILLSRAVREVAHVKFSTHC